MARVEQCDFFETMIFFYTQWCTEIFFFKLIINANCCFYVVTILSETSIDVQLCPYVDNFSDFDVFCLSIVCVFGDFYLSAFCLLGGRVFALLCSSFVLHTERGTGQGEEDQRTEANGIGDPTSNLKT